MQRDPFKGQDLGFVVNLLRSTIQKYFIVNDVRFDKEAFAFFVQLDMRTLEQDFDDCRRELLDLGYLPMLLQERPGYIVYVTHIPERSFRSININVVLLIATIISTIFAGMLFVASYEDIPFWSWETVGLGALYFALPLMVILSVHEMGHYVMARKHRIAASLPFFIPAPTILGTFGAFISLREPIHSKRALIDIGFAGPITGFVVAVFVTILGFKLTAWDPHLAGDDASEYMILGVPIIYTALAYLVPTPEGVLIHPTAFAGWVGFLVTAINLLPAGQLDGGHIIRALLADKAKFAGIATVVAMVFISWYTGYWGWIVFVMFILLVLHHPPPLNDISPLPPNRWYVGAATLILLVVCFVPAPFMPAELSPDLEIEIDEPDINVGLNASGDNTLVFRNEGNTRVDVKMRLQSDHEWTFTFDDKVDFDGLVTEWSEPFTIAKDKSTNYTTYVNVTVEPPEAAVAGDSVDFVVEVEYTDESDERVRETPHFRAVVGWIEPRDVPEDAFVPVDTVRSFEVSFNNMVTNRSGGDTRFDLDLHIEGDLDYTLTDSNIKNLTREDLALTPPLPHIDLGNNDTAQLLIWVYPPPGTPSATGLQVSLNVTYRGDDSSTTTIGFSLVVSDVVFDVSISSTYLSWNFTKDGIKNVTFRLVSHSTVDTYVAINYSFDGDDAFEFTGTRVEEILLLPGEDRGLTVVLFAPGDVGDMTELTVEISYGLNQGSSVKTVLRITTT
jgi:membrane-associated protease RseP (regulator of RpoE activity)